MIHTETTAGSLADLQSGCLAVSEDNARQHGWKVGSVVPMEFPANGVQRVPVKAIFRDNQLNGGYLLSLTDYQKGYSTRLDSMVIAKARPGADQAAVRAAVDQAVADFPNVRVQDMAQYRQKTGKQLDRLLNLVRSLLAFAIVIALFGIVNTLALSVFERVRELGLLRVVGATRRQVRSMIRWEAVIISVLGAVLGMAVGVFFGWTMVRALASEGFGEFTVPGGQLVAYVLLAAVAAVLGGGSGAKVMADDAARKECTLTPLDEAHVDADPIVQFGRWFAEANTADLIEPTAMTLATADAAGRPSARMVLLKGFDERGFVFYTNYGSRKAGELAANPLAALVLWWPPLQRQVRVEGTVERVLQEESEAYFRTRPLGSRLGAWASAQSQVIEGRAELERRLEELAERYRDGNVPLPPFWGGYRVHPEVIEFWQNRPDRLHDRLRYRRAPGGWTIERLSP